MAAIAALRLMAQWKHLLASIHRMDQQRCVAAIASAIVERAGRRRRGEPEYRSCRFRQRAGKKGGAHTGPSPVDRAKKGCKRHIITDACGIPLIVVCTPGNVRDDTPFIAMLDTMPPVKMPSGPPRYKPGQVAGDAAYGQVFIIPQVIERRVLPLLAPRSMPGHPVKHGSGLGRVRYVVERTIAWLGSFRRIERCYERTGQAWQAFNELACCVICAGKLGKLYQQRMAA
jgi:transposase